MSVKRWAERAFVLLFYIGLWAIAARAVAQPLLLPPPSSVLHKLAELLPQRTFWQTILFTLGRTASAYLLGILTAVILAVLCFRVRLARLLLSPLMTAVRATPVTSFIVLALVWLSSAHVPILTGFLMVLPIVYSALFQALHQVDPKLIEMAGAYQISAARHVILPSVLPAFMESCLASIGLCWKAVVAAEVIGVPKLAIGSRLYEAKIYLETDSLLAWTLTIVLLSVLLEALLRHAVHRLTEVRHD